MKSGNSFDTIVIGLGAMGAATLWQLAKQGQRVLGIDRWEPPHSFGSTHGDTRVTRCSIAEGEVYVPFVQRSHEIWRELEAETGQSLLTQCGMMILAPREVGALLHGKPDFVRRTVDIAARHGIEHEVLAPEEVMRRYPRFRLQGSEIAYFEPGGGYVRPERCVAAQLAAAGRLGAAIRTSTTVTAVVRDGDGVCVTTEAGDRFRAGRAVLAAGAWSPGLAGPALGPHMRVYRQTLHWFAVDDPAAFAPERFPVFIWSHGPREEDSFYGFPIPPGGEGVKLGTEQYGEQTIDPDTLRRDVDPAEAALLMRDNVTRRLAGVAPTPLRSASCPYTVTQDGDFIISALPENDRVLLVSACSGHGFKHSAALGEAVAAAVVSSDHAVFAPFTGERLRVA